GGATGFTIGRRDHQISAGLPGGSSATPDARGPSVAQRTSAIPTAFRAVGPGESLNWRWAMASSPAAGTSAGPYQPTQSAAPLQPSVAKACRRRLRTALTLAR